MVKIYANIDTLKGGTNNEFLNGASKRALLTPKSIEENDTCTESFCLLVLGLAQVFGDQRFELGN